ncbi:MAG: hypothetical protein QM607_09940, partial [Microbacterium sp.]
PALRPVGRKSRRPRFVYAVIAMAGAVLIALAQMGLSTMSTQSSFEIQKLQAQQRSLDIESQALYDQVAGLASPQNLAQKATDLGMVIDNAPTYLRLSDGAITGSATAASASSTIDASGQAAVTNDFLAQNEKLQQSEEQGASDDDVTTATLPPAITDGLPTPKTH